MEDLEKIAIYESKHSDKAVAFATEGFGMSEKWWANTHKLQQNGLLWGVYQTPKGLRRIIL